MLRYSMLKPPGNVWWPLLLVATYLAFAVSYLHNYFIPDLNLYLGLAMAPYLLLFRKGEFSFRYAFPTVLLLLLAIFIPVKSLVYLTMIFGVLLLLESTVGKVSYYILFLLLILSTVFHYFSNFFGFPIRLWLSKITGQLLEFTGQQIEVSGNLIAVNGAAFSVDPACAGLKMMAVSFMLALFVLAFYQRRTGRNASLLQVSAVLTVTLLLNIGANLFRIILLVLFRVPPENIFHDLIGMACLVLYVVAPLLFISGKLVRNGRQTQGKTAKPIALKPRHALALAFNFLILIATVLVGLRTEKAKAAIANAEIDLHLPGYQIERMAEGISKFENAQALVYVKPVRFYAAEHNPMVCWTGSGYNFQQINTQVIYGKEIYTGVLQKGRDKLYTAWWFDKGKLKTISQLEWRWAAAQTEEPFNLINVSAASPEMLHKKLHYFLNQSLFN